MDKGFYIDALTCNVHYKETFLDYQVNKITNIKNEKEYYINDIQYIKRFIEFIKQNIIKKLPNLNLVKVELNIYDKDNLLHSFIIKITNIICELQNIKLKLNLNKMIFVNIKYDNHVVFLSLIDFNHL